MREKERSRRSQRDMRRECKGLCLKVMMSFKMATIIGLILIFKN